MPDQIKASPLSLYNGRSVGVDAPPCAGVSVLRRAYLFTASCGRALIAEQESVSFLLPGTS